MLAIEYDVTPDGGMGWERQAHEALERYSSTASIGT